MKKTIPCSPEAFDACPWAKGCDALYSLRDKSCDARNRRARGEEVQAPKEPLIFHDCLPEVMAVCPWKDTTQCEGRFPARYGACRTRNRAELREQARKEAAGYGVKNADHPGPL